MAYIINKYNGDQAAVVEDGTINTTLDLKLIGKNYAGYGEAQNENYTWLLENFASQTAPPKAVIGQLWYDTSIQKLKINNGVGKWRTLGVIELVTSNSSSKIADLEEGDFFWNTTTEQLWCKSATENVLIGGKLIGITTQMKASTVTGIPAGSITPQQYKIIEASVDDVTTFIISGNLTEFTLHSGEDLLSAGFEVIYPGVTIKGINTSSFTSDSYKFWGTASDSQRLDGNEASEYINKTTPIFPNIANFSDAGLSVGTTPNERLYIKVVGLTPIIHNQSNDTIVFRTTDISTSLPLTSLRLVGEDILPGNADNSNLGSPLQKFDTVHAATFSGNAYSADGVTLDGDRKLASADADADTVVIRTATAGTYLDNPIDAGSVVGSHFAGIVFIGAGADLAEKYLADETYSTGTVVMIGGDAEITAAQSNYRAVGVVSENPSHIMNSGLQGGTIVGLKGRVPVKVLGKVKKGDRLISADNGVAIAYTLTDDSSLVFAVALETNKSDDIKLVEALVL